MSVNIKIRKSKKEHSLFSIILISSVLSVLIFLIMLSAFSLFIMKNHTEKTMLQMFVIVSSGISALFTAFFSSYFAKTKRFVCGMLNAVFIIIAEFLLMLCCNNINLYWQIYLMLPVSVLTAFAGCVAGINLKR